MNTFKHNPVTITSKKMISSAMHVMKCPVCGTIVASASERSLLPNFTTCNGWNEPKILSRKKLNPAKEYRPITLGVGSKIQHKKFGFGIILNEDEDRVDINFETAGNKNLLKQFANLKLL